MQDFYSSRSFEVRTRYRCSVGFIIRHSFLLFDLGARQAVMLVKTTAFLQQQKQVWHLMMITVSCRKRFSYRLKAPRSRHTSHAIAWLDHQHNRLTKTSHLLYPRVNLWIRRTVFTCHRQYPLHLYSMIAHYICHRQQLMIHQ